MWSKCVSLIIGEYKFLSPLIKQCPGGGSLLLVNVPRQLALIGVITISVIL